MMETVGEERLAATDLAVTGRFGFARMLALYDLGRSTWELLVFWAL